MAKETLYPLYPYQIEVVGVEPSDGSHRSIEGRAEAVVLGPELRRQEDVGPVDPAVNDRLAEETLNAWRRTRGFLESFGLLCPAVELRNELKLWQPSYSASDGSDKGGMPNMIADDHPRYIKPEGRGFKSLCWQIDFLVVQMSCIRSMHFCLIYVCK